ncbi:MAG: HTTM domain-containing protein [Bacteroidota bacterium]
MTNIVSNKLNNWLFKRVSIAPLVIFRICFGFLLLYSNYRTYEEGWIKELYIDPIFHFGFVSWLNPLSGNGMYVIFGLLGLCSICIILGLFYRFSTASYFVLFTYVELLDKTYYLNHYYLVSLLVFWMIWVPAHHWHSIDSKLFPKIKSATCNNWHILIFKFQLSIVYFFAGLAKVNPDWLFRAQPMATWLPGKYQLPLIGPFMNLKGIAFLFSWLGCIYDLTIWIFLWIRKTRVLAYVAVLVFHILTGILFPRIGMFPYIMITSTLIFFSDNFHGRILRFIGGRLPDDAIENSNPTISYFWQSVISKLLILYLAIQLLLPMRYLVYGGNLFWHEKGYRFSWRVMLMEKNGYTSFIVRDPVKNEQKEVNPDIYLTPFQKQQLRSQPDMMLQFGKFLGDRFKAQNGYNPEVYVKSRISLNARRSQQFTDDTYDIYNNKNPMQEGWILKFEDK